MLRGATRISTRGNAGEKVRECWRRKAFSREGAGRVLLVEAAIAEA